MSNKYDWDYRRGYSVVALENPRNSINVGQILRGAFCFRANYVVVAGRMWAEDEEFQDPEMPLPADTPKAWRHVPLIYKDSIQDSLPLSCTPVAVEMTDDAVSLSDFVHPERAMYVFGSEYGGIKKETVDWCEKVIHIPTRVSLNLAVTVNLVLYDRMAKRHGLNLSKKELEKFGI